MMILVFIIIEFEDVNQVIREGIAKNNARSSKNKNNVDGRSHYGENLMNNITANNNDNNSINNSINNSCNRNDGLWNC